MREAPPLAGRPYPCDVFGSVVDLILIALIVMFALNGYGQGFAVGALSFVGFFGGALIGLQLASVVVSRIDAAAGRVFVCLAMVFGLALVGHTTAAWAGTKLRYAIQSERGRRADAIGGIFVSVMAFLLVAWMLAGPLASSSVPSVARAVRNSAILAVVDGVMPNQARILSSGLRDTIADGDFPTVFGDLTSTRARAVPPPNPMLADSARGRTARQSTVKVRGSVLNCPRTIEGSGFVYAPEYVMTNAHVVAGTRRSLEVEINGDREAGWVVLYDPDLDLAVLYVPGLRRSGADVGRQPRPRSATTRSSSATRSTDPSPRRRLASGTFAACADPTSTAAARWSARSTRSGPGCSAATPVDR